MFFRIKFDADGDVEHFKARLVARRFIQKDGVDFSETFAPVIKMSSGLLRELIYIKAPRELDVEAGKVLKLINPLYGLKQWGRCWNETMNEYIIALNFIKPRLDPCIFYKREKRSG